jgi:DNA-binding transcriptional MocR family regulator
MLAQAFMGPGETSAHVRVSFSLIEEEAAIEAFKRLRRVVLDAQKST